MHRATLGRRLRYWFDTTLARGTAALVGWLAVLSLALILLFTLVVWTLGALGFVPTADSGAAPGPVEDFWTTFLHAFNSGQLGGDKGSWPFLLTMLGVTLGGIFILSTLIGLLSNGITTQLDALRRGRSAVIETGHTLILGWSEQVFTIVTELVIANANQKHACIVILAPHDKVVMEEQIRTKVGATGKTRLVCRTGWPTDLDDLEIVNPQGARSILVMTPQVDEPDAQVLKTVLALTNSPRRRPAPYHIVAAITHPRNMEAARLVGGNEAQFIEVGDTAARLIAQTCRQAGLSAVYTELFDFGGDEIYFQDEPALVGKTVGEALHAYEDSAVIGLQRPDGQVVLNPPLDTRIALGDKIVAISEDDDTVRLSGWAAVPIEVAAIQVNGAYRPAPERILLLGWNLAAPLIITQLDAYVAPGSTLLVVAGTPEATVAVGRCCAELRNLRVTAEHGETTSRPVLDHLAIPGYDHVVVLGDQAVREAERADARTLMTLLHLRDIQRRTSAHFSIVSEMRDDRNRQLAEVTQADDFIVSDKLFSLMMTQMAENKDLAPVFADLLDPAGAEIYLKPVERYVTIGQPLTFYTVVEAARRYGEIAIGYKILAAPPAGDTRHGVVVNPDKSRLITFAAGDRVIVLADE